MKHELGDKSKIDNMGPPPLGSRTSGGHKTIFLVQIDTLYLLAFLDSLISLTLCSPCLLDLYNLLTRPSQIDTLDLLASSPSSISSPSAHPLPFWLADWQVFTSFYCTALQLPIGCTTALCQAAWTLSTVPGCLSASCTGLLQLVILPSPLVSASSWFYPDAIGLNINNGQWKELCRKIRHSIIFQTQICNLASHRLQRFQPLQCLAISSTKRAPLAFSCWLIAYLLWASHTAPIFLPQNPRWNKVQKWFQYLYAVFSLGLSAEASWLLFLKNAQLRAQHTRPNFKQINSAFKAMAQTKLNPILRFSGNLSIRFSTAQKPVKYFKILNQIFQPGILAF